MSEDIEKVIQTLAEIAPPELALLGDKIGLQVGPFNRKISKGVVTLDRSLAACKSAIELGAELIVSHHPLIWSPFPSLLTEVHDQRTALLLAKHEISLFVCHTNWDCAIGGVNCTLAEKIGLRNVDKFGSPAAFNPNSKFAPVPIGRIGDLNEAVTATEFSAWVETCLFTKVITWGNPATKVQKIALVGGAAADEWKQAKEAAADCFITGEVQHHIGIEASESGLFMIQAGHYATEQPGVESLQKELTKALPAISWHLHSPEY